MVRKRVFVITVIALVIIIGVQTLIIVDPAIIGKHKVTTPENAIIIAKAALLKKYGEKEISQIEFDAVIFGDQPSYWNVSANTDTLGFAPHVLVRRSDGKVMLRWDT